MPGAETIPASRVRRVIDRRIREAETCQRRAREPHVKASYAVRIEFFQTVREQLLGARLQPYNRQPVLPLEASL